MLSDEDFVLLPATTPTTTISKTTQPSSIKQIQNKAVTNTSSNSNAGKRKANADKTQLEKPGKSTY